MKHPLAPQEPLISFGSAPAQTALPRTFRLSVWNLHKCAHADWKKDFSGLCAQTDLFLVQEMRLSPAVMQTAVQSSLHWHAAISFLFPKGKHPTGVACGARAAAQDIRFNAQSREPLLRLPKMTLCAVYPIAQSKLLALNLHGINFTGLEAFKQQLAAAAALCANWQGPLIAAGDFNAWSQKRQNEMRREAQTLGLREVLFRPDERTRYMGKPVDFIFTRGLETLSSSVAPLYSSDHRPLCAVLRLA